MKTKHFTLAVVCAATAMLMLDIAVVNTALSRIAEDLKTDLSGLQWIVDAYTLALASAVLTAGALADRLGRRRVFAVGLALFTAASAVCAMSGSIDMLIASRAVQGIGAAILFAVSLALLANAFPGERELALLRGNDQGWTSAAIITELGAAAALLVAFVAVERKAREPMLPLGLFRVPAFTGAQLAAFAISGSFFAVFLYATLYLQQILGLSAIEAGLVYVPGTVVMFGVSAATANLSAKVHPGVLVSGGLALVSAGMILMSAMTGVDSSWTAVVPGTILAMIGTGLFSPAVIAVALGATPADQSGLAAGVNDTFRQGGIAVGVAGLGALVPAADAFGGGAATAYVDGLHNALLAGAGLAGLGAVAAALLIAGKRAPAPAVAPALATEGC
jgi:predicted MFS family arabinose efflux permease